MAKRIPYIPNRVIDTNGISDGASIYVYQTGTTTPVSIYSDEALTTPISNPLVVAAGAAVPVFYHNESGDIRVRVVEDGGAVVSDEDPFQAPVMDRDLASTASGKGAALVGTEGGGTVQSAVVTIPEVIASPTASAAIRKASQVRIANAHGLDVSWLALNAFTFTDLDAAIWKASPDLSLLHRPRPRTGTPPTPAGYTAPPFSMAYGAEGRIATSIDNDKVFRDTYAVAPYITGSTLNVFYVDPDTGNDANSGKTWALAKATITGTDGAKNALNATGQAGVIYVRTNGKCMNRNVGLSHSSPVTVDYAIIGVDGANGKTWFGNIYGSTDVSFSANATYSWVYETATGTMTQPGRTFDLSHMDIVVDDLGREIEVPREYVSKSTLADVAATPGSYWFDSGASKWYVHMIGGQSPTMGTDLCVCRSAIEIYALGRNGQDCYMENVGLIGGIVFQSYPNANVYMLNTLSVGARQNGFYFDQCANVIQKGCVSFSPTLDGLNAHNIGANITDITKANPAVVTVSSAHNLENGDQVVIEPTTTGASIGMDELLNTTFTVANKTSTTFELQGVDSTGYTTYTSGGKARIPTSKYSAINCTTLRNTTDAGSNQSISLHENVKGWIVNGLFKEPGRDHITNINTSECWVLGSRFTGYRPTGEINRIAQATDLAKVAMDGVDWGGYVDAATTLFAGNSTHKMKLLNMDLPTNAQASNVTLSW